MKFIRGCFTIIGVLVVVGACGAVLVGVGSGNRERTSGTNGGGAPVSGRAAPPSAERNPAVEEHIANARDHRQQGDYGLALIEIDQAVALDATSNARTIQTDIRGEATRTAQSAAALATQEAANRPQLELLAGDGCRRSSTGFFEYTGQVRNISGQSMRNVQALVTYYATDGSFVTSDSALIEYNPILPNQVSPFRVLTRTNPAIARCAVEFKFLSGGAIRLRTP